MDHLISNLLYRIIGYEAIQIMFYHSYLSMYHMYLITTMVDTTDNAVVMSVGSYYCFPSGRCTVDQKATL